MLRYVYYKEEDKKNQKNTWMACSKCSRWVHIFCEQKYGGLQTSNPKEYLCPGCRNPSATPEHVDHQMPTSVMYEAEVLANAILNSPPEHQVISLVSPDAMMQ